MKKPQSEANEACNAHRKWRKWLAVQTFGEIHQQSKGEIVGGFFQVPFRLESSHKRTL